MTQSEKTLLKAARESVDILDNLVETTHCPGTESTLIKLEKAIALYDRDQDEVCER